MSSVVVKGKKRRILSDTATSLISSVDLTVASNSVIERRTSEGTKSNYAQKVKQIAQWYEESWPQEVVDGKLSLPLSDESVIAFFTHKCMFAIVRKDLKGRHEITEATANEPYVPSYLTGFRSALVDLYRLKKQKMSQYLNDKLKELLDGYEKMCNDLKKKGLMTLNPGKRELRRDGYILICTKLMKYKPPMNVEAKKKTGSTKRVTNSGSWATSVFAWSFFTLLWNLISRPESVENITLNMITWKDDCLTIDEHVSIL